MRDIIRKWDEDGVLLRRAQTVMPFVELARELSGQVPDFLKREGAVPAAFVPRLARQVLSGDYGVPEAFCRLGTSLTHILVDEFQDTSREQWEAIHPLVLEALSRGGSLTWVGDVKQAIYGWRGGDATLFDEVRSDAELCAVAPEPRVDILPTNWRSCRAIVETNNTLFRQLSETATAKAVLSAMLPKDTPSALLATILEEGAQLLKEGFAGSEQKVAPDKAEGFLRLQRVYGDKSEDLDEEVRERLLGCVQEVVSRRPWGDVTVLVRSNGKAAQVAGWLMEEGIPVVTDNSFLLAEHPLVEQLTALLTFLDSPRNDLAFWTFLSGRQMLLPLIPLSEQALEDWAAAPPDVRSAATCRCSSPSVKISPTSGGSGSRLSMPTRGCSRPMTSPAKRWGASTYGAAIPMRPPLSAAFWKSFTSRKDKDTVRYPRSSTIGTSTGNRKKPPCRKP